MTTRTDTHTTSTFDRMATDDRFLGFGYIGGRRNAIEEGWDTSAADALALEMAHGMSYEKLFAWANSKNGRWFADCSLGCDDLTMARRYGPGAR